MINKINSCNQNPKNFTAQKQFYQNERITPLSGYEDHFVSSMKTTLPTGAALGTMLSIIETRKNFKTLPTALGNNIPTFLVIGALLSGVDAILKTNFKSSESN